jgi:hypothetical protein
MKNFYNACIALLFIFSVTQMQAQNVGISEIAITPDGSSILELRSTTKGVLIPRLALTQTTSAAPVTSPATSLLVFNTATVNDVTPGFYYWSGSAWVRLLSGTIPSSGWALTGNAGTNPSTNFLGTTDAQSFVIRTNNTERIRVLSTGNTGIGTTTPAEQLDVSANIRAGGIVYWGTSGIRTETRNDAGLIGSRSGFFETAAPAPAANWPTGATNWWHLLDVRHSNTTNNYAMQFAGSFFDQDLYFRKTNDNAAQPWTRIMTSASYASGISYDYSTASMTAPISSMGIITGMTRTLNLKAGDILYLHAHGGLMAAGINWGAVEFAIRVNGVDLPNGGYTKVSVDYDVAYQAFANWAISGHYPVPADGSYTIAVYCGRFGGNGNVTVGGDNTTVTQGSLRIEIVRPNI